MFLLFFIIFIVICQAAVYLTKWSPHKIISVLKISWIVSSTLLFFLSINNFFKRDEHILFLFLLVLVTFISYFIYGIYKEKDHLEDFKIPQTPTIQKIMTILFVSIIWIFLAMFESIIPDYGRDNDWYTFFIMLSAIWVLYTFLDFLRYAYYWNIYNNNFLRKKIREDLKAELREEILLELWIKK